VIVDRRALIAASALALLPAPLAAAPAADAAAVRAAARLKLAYEEGVIADLEALLADPDQQDPEAQRAIRADLVVREAVCAALRRLLRRR
jgi:hypothetical protein